MDGQALPPRPRFLPPGFGTVGHQDFVEIIAPPPVPYEPKTAGWYVLAGVLLVVMGYGATRAVRRYRRDAYRRMSLGELRGLKSRIGTDRHRVLLELPCLLKRSALAVFPREQVASLHGQTWLDFLEEKGPGTFSQSSKAALLTLTLGSPEDLPSAADGELMNSVGSWIRRHRSERQGG